MSQESTERGRVQVLPTQREGVLDSVWVNGEGHVLMATDAGFS